MQACLLSLSVIVLSLLRYLSDVDACELSSGVVKYRCTLFKGCSFNKGDVYVPQRAVDTIESSHQASHELQQASDMLYSRRRPNCVCCSFAWPAKKIVTLSPALQVSGCPERVLLLTHALFTACSFSSQMFRFLLIEHSLVTLRSCISKGPQGSSWRGSSGSSSCCTDTHLGKPP